jgi:hypothetical protein
MYSPVEEEGMPKEREAPPRQGVKKRGEKNGVRKTKEKQQSEPGSSVPKLEQMCWERALKVPLASHPSPREAEHQLQLSTTQLVQ